MALGVDQIRRRVDVELAERSQTLRLDAEIGQICGKRGPKPVTLRGGLAGRVERVAQCNLEPLADAFEDRLDIDRAQLLARRTARRLRVKRGPAAPRERQRRAESEREQHAATHRVSHATILTMRFGTTMTLRGGRPSSQRSTCGKASAASSTARLSTSRGTSSVPRSLPLTWMAIVTC